MPRHKSKKGVGQGKGGGPKPNWFRHRCRELVFENKIPELWANVAIGENFDQVVIKETGEVLPVPANMKERLVASMHLTEYAEGKPAQIIDVRGVDESDYRNLSARALKEILEHLDKRDKAKDSG